MTIKLRFFAALRERAGASETTREISEPTTVGALWEKLRRERASLGDYSGPVRFAVNQEYVDKEYPVQDNDEVAFIPPVSGG